MIAFLVIAAVMIAAALGLVIVPLLRGSRSTGIAREASNVAILRHQLQELEADVANGVVSQAQYDQAKSELLERTLEESKASAGGPPNVPSAAGAWTAAILGGAVPIAAALLYFTLGSHEAFSPAANLAADSGKHDLSPAKVEEMIGKLEARLKQEPDNAEGWSLLAHTYYAMNRMPQAVAAYQRAAALAPDDATLLADYADALASQQNGIEGKPMELVTRALKADPTQWKALALAGTAAFDRRDFKLAVDYWEKARAGIPAESGIAKSLDGSIAEAKQLGGITGSAQASAAMPAAPVTAAAAAPAPAKPAPADAKAGASGATIAGRVQLSPALSASVAPTDTVWVFARAANGPRMPLAILRKEVKDLPVTFALDDSMAMQPNMKISSFPEVVIGARVSKSGNAAPQSGDLEGLSKPVKVGANGVAVVIDTRIP